MGNLTEIIVANMALSRIGISRSITTDGTGLLVNATNASLELTACTFWFSRCRDRVLADFPWTFARKYTTLTLADDGTGEVWVDEWDNAYTYPSDCLHIRRFVTGAGAGTSHGADDVQYGPLSESLDTAWPYVVRQHAGVQVILTDVAEADAKIEYTARVTDQTLWTEQYGSVLAWLLAAEIAMPLSVSGDRRDTALRYYDYELRLARANSANEERQHREPDGPFIRARGGA